MGELHGFSTTIPAADGERRVCVYAIDSTGGKNPSIGCKTVTATNTQPRASLDVVNASDPSSVLVRGWAFDPDDDSAAVTVRYVVNGTVVGSEPAQTSRPDVARVFGVSEYHGYSTRIALTQGRHEVCVDALDASTSAVRRVACRTVDVADTPTVGSLTAVEPGRAEVTVSGWAWDYDRPDRPVAISVLVDGTTAGTTSADRALSPTPEGAGRGNVGYTATVPFTPGTREVCVRATDPSSGTAVTLGCETVTVANSLPFGSLDVAQGGTGTVRVRGWAIDPDTTNPIAVHVRVDGALVAGFHANTSRPDVDRVHGMGEQHGFDRTIAVDVDPGPHQVCVYAINWPAGPNPRIACREVTVTGP
jgi:hypothetical protein